jgi:hypothetical protein
MGGPKDLLQSPAGKITSTNIIYKDTIKVNKYEKFNLFNHYRRIINIDITFNFLLSNGFDNTINHCILILQLIRTKP